MTDETRAINQSITVNAPVEAIFKAFTNAREMERWWPSKVESDPRTGGSFKFTFENNPEDAPAHVRAGDYLEVVQTERIKYPWNIPGMEPATQVEVRIAATGEGTSATVIHSGWPAAEELNEVFEMHDQGWGGFLNNLKIVMEGGEDIRPTAMDMKTTATS